MRFSGDATGRGSAATGGCTGSPAGGCTVAAFTSFAHSASDCCASCAATGSAGCSAADGLTCGVGVDRFHCCPRLLRQGGLCKCDYHVHFVLSFNPSALFFTFICSHTHLCSGGSARVALSLQGDRFMHWLTRYSQKNASL